MIAERLKHCKKTLERISKVTVRATAAGVYFTRGCISPGVHFTVGVAVDNYFVQINIAQL